ncbi:MAG: Maf family protein [Candidatus Thermoplasmatota archaeon]
MRLILASASPRRKRLLEEAGILFEARPTSTDETPPRGVAPTEVAVELAVRKARAAEDGGALVLAADTLIDLDGEVLGKPHDVAEARRFLRTLSGRDHWVITGVAVRRAQSLWTGFGRTQVTFRSLSDAEIDAYVATGEPMDKAGAYAIQGGAAGFVARVDGAMDNVVGLPMDVVRRLLRDAQAPG